MVSRAVFGSVLSLALAVALPAAPVFAESHDTPGRSSEVYQSGDYRIAPPNSRPVSNFYNLRGFRYIDPRCFAGVITSAADVAYPVGSGSFYADERIVLRPRRASGARYVHRHTWQLSADPLEIAGVVSTSEGVGSGTARVALAVSMAHGLYRLVTDVRPREGTYTITTTGPGVSRMAVEDFHFAFGDHHYSYVDLSGLGGAGALAGDIRAGLMDRPPNVFMGEIDWLYDDMGRWVGELGIEEVDSRRLTISGMSGSAERQISIRIICQNLIDQFERRWGRD